MSTLVYTTPGTITDTSVPILERDDILIGDSDGVRFLYDLANSFCYTPGTPTNGKAVNDLGQISAAGSIVNPTGQLAAGGGGLDWTSVANGSGNRSGLIIPNSVVADLWAAQNYMIVAYVKLPAAADWPIGNGYDTTIFSHATASWASAAELMAIGFAGNGSASIGIRANRQRAAATAEVNDSGIGTAALHGGLVAQVAVWRTATDELKLRVKSSAGTTNGTVTFGANSDNTQNFSAQSHGFGNLGTFGQYEIATHGNGLRHFRGFIENLATSGRDPVTVLDADYARTIARAVYS